MKRQLMIALLAMLTVSILPGCGKKKNDSGTVIGAPVGVPPPINSGTGGCYNTSSMTNSGITLGFNGSVTGGSGITSYMALYSTGGGVPGGYTNTYYRQNIYGDRVDIAISGNNAYAQVSISASAVAWVNVYGGGQICGFYVDANVYNPAIQGSAWSGNIGGGPVSIITKNGQQLQL